MSKETIEREVNGRKRKNVIDVKPKLPEMPPFDPTGMADLVKVTRAEFDEFIKNYPRRLDKDFFMDVYTWNDFTRGWWPYSIVAKVNAAMYDAPEEYYIPKDPKAVIEFAGIKYPYGPDVGQNAKEIDADDIEQGITRYVEGKVDK